MVSIKDIDGNIERLCFPSSWARVFLRITNGKVEMIRYRMNPYPDTEIIPTQSCMLGLGYHMSVSNDTINIQHGRKEQLNVNLDFKKMEFSVSTRCREDKYLLNYSFIRKIYENNGILCLRMGHPQGGIKTIAETIFFAEKSSFDLLIKKNYSYIFYCNKLKFDNPFKNCKNSLYTRLFFMTNHGEIIHILKGSIDEVNAIYKVQKAVAWLVLYCPNLNNIEEDILYVEVSNDCTGQLIKALPSIDRLREM